MIVYNVTTNVSWAIHDEWLRWMREEHIPLMLLTGYFFESRIMRLLEIDDKQGPTYAIQMHASCEADYQAFIKLHAESLHQQAHDRWGDQIITFSSVMEVLH